MALLRHLVADLTGDEYDRQSVSVSCRSPPRSP
jgi:hypothetical protein